MKGINVSTRETLAKAYSVFRVASGNFLEMYNFMLFAYYAQYIAHDIFPSNSEFASIMLALGTFGAAYLMRPLGAIVLGVYIDRHGRRTGLIFTLLLMGVGTGVIAFVPTVRTIGILAPIIVVLGCLLQGLSAGVMLGGVTVYLAEIATPGHRGFYSSWQSASNMLSVVTAATLGVTLTTLLTRQSMAAWGWRIPFMIGTLIAPVLIIWLVKTMPETGAFLARKKRPGVSQLLASMVSNWKIVGVGVMLCTMTTITFYMVTAYTAIYGRMVLHLTARASLVVTLCGGLTSFILLPIGGAVSDKLGRKPQMIFFTVAALLTAYPAMSWLVSSPSVTRLLVVELWFACIFAFYNGATMPLLAEIMPQEVRTTGFALAYSLAVAIFGGFTPAICTYLVHATGNLAMPAVWLSMAALIGLSATLLSGLPGLGLVKWESSVPAK
jgi:MFS family permease